MAESRAKRRAARKAAAVRARFKVGAESGQLVRWSLQSGGGPLGSAWLPSGAVVRCPGDDFAITTGGQWAGVIGPDWAEVERWLLVMGAHCARRARGRKVSDTSVQEAQAAARCAVIDYCAQWVAGDWVGRLGRSVRAERAGRWVPDWFGRLVALGMAAATESLRDNGLTGRSDQRRNVAFVGFDGGSGDWSS